MRVASSIAMIAAAFALMAANTEPPPTVPRAVSSEEQSRIVDLRRVVEDLPVGKKVAHECGGGDLFVTKSGLQRNLGNYRPAFLKEAEAAGYKTANATAVFNAPGAGTQAQLIMGAAITDVLVETCVTTTASITITWQVYDPYERKVVLTISTHGDSKVRATGDAARGIMVAAFASAADQLFLDPDFHRIAVSPIAKPSEKNTADALAPPAARTIAKQALSSLPFEKRVHDITAQVVTIFRGDSYGSGFFIADGLLLTNEHVVTDAPYVKVRLSSGREMVGEVLGTNARRDVALVKTDAIGLPGLPLHTDDPPLGSRVFVVGTPLQLSETVTAGIVGAFPEDKEHGRFIQSDVNVQHGNSGGPMLDEFGNVIGITDLGKELHGVAQGINFFIPIGDALKSVNIGFAGQPSS